MFCHALTITSNQHDPLADASGKDSESGPGASEPGADA